MLKSGILFFLFAVVVLAEEPPPEIRKYKEECKKEYGIDAEVVHNIKNLPEEKKCYYKCVVMKLDLITDDGEITPDAFKNKIKSINGPENLLEAIDKCTGIKEANPCLTAESLYKCIRPH